MTFALPAVAGLKSRLVHEEEQGRMQSAISTVSWMQSARIRAGCHGRAVVSKVYVVSGSVGWRGAIKAAQCKCRVYLAVQLLGLQASHSHCERLRTVIGGIFFEEFGNVSDTGSFDKLYILAAGLVLLNLAGMHLNL